MARSRSTDNALVTREVASTGGSPLVTVTRAGLGVIERTAAKGGSRDIVAAALGIGKATFHRLLERDEAARLAWEKGMAADEAHHIAVLRKAASKGYAAASMFLLKARHGYRENDVVPTTQTGIVITLPAAMTHEQWEAHRAQQRAALSAPIDVEFTTTKEMPHG